MMSDEDEVLAGSWMDVLLPTDIAIPVTDEPAPVLETIRFSIQLSWNGKNAGGYAVSPPLTSRRHVIWPTDGYHEEVNAMHGGRQMICLRHWAGILVRQATREDFQPEFDPSRWEERGPVMDYWGRWWMAPADYRIDAPFHPNTQEGIYRLASVNFLGYMPVW